MTPKDALREWITSRATDAADAKRASSLIAAFVVEAVKADRAKRTAEQATVDAVRSHFDDVRRTFREMSERMR